jgi:hypothetical protein
VSATLGSILHKLHDGPDSFLSGLAHPGLVQVAAAMHSDDPTIVFDSLRPLGDEFWNLIDGQRSLGQIAEELCMQFGFELRPERFLPLADGMAEKGLIRLA